MTHNMGLLVLPGDYLGTDRQGVVDEIISRISTASPDVVGLCEVFDDLERDTIRVRLKQLYPHSQEGPDESDLESDGGLLLLSKHPIIEHHQTIFEDCTGFDCLANKGVIHIRVQTPGLPARCDIYLSHAQDIEADSAPFLSGESILPKTAEESLYAQLTHMNTFVRNTRDPEIPSIIMGDLNIPAEVSAHYAQLLERLGDAVDLWVVAGNTSASGPTFVSDNNFYEDDDDNPHQNHRLDYVLMKAGLKCIPILASIDILKFKRDGRFISDHFGLLSRFDHAFKIEF